MAEFLQKPPFWATPAGVAFIVAGYCIIFILLGGPLASGLTIDDAIENYLVQGLTVSYSPRNPPLFDWMIYGVQQIAGAGHYTFLIVRYALLFAAALLVHQIARRCIRDPRLQALAVFSLALFWVIGYHTHRNFNHSNVMIVAIAGSFLTLMDLRNSPSSGRYALLGVWVTIGTLAKFGFLAYFGMAVAGAIALREYRAVVLSPRFLITFIVAAVPLVAYLLAVRLENANLISGLQGVVGPRASSFDTSRKLLEFGGGLAGYLLPFAAIAFLCFRVPMRTSANRLHDASTVKLLAIIVGAGILVSFAAVLIGTFNVRDRYFHVWCLLAGVLTFALIDSVEVQAAQVRRFVVAASVIVASIALVFLTQRLAPDPRLCQNCFQSAPFPELGRIIAARFGAAPTLISVETLIAGQLRAGTPGTRVLVTDVPERPPITKPAGPCLMIWPLDPDVRPLSASMKEIASTAKVDTERPEMIEVNWWAPLLPGGRTSKWAVLRLPADTPVCR